MKKLFGLLVFLFVMYLIIQISFRIFDKGHSIEYKLDNFNIKEVYVQNVKNETDNYYFEITIDNSMFNFETHKNLNRNSKVIKKVNYFKNSNYECIFPEFRDNTFVTDVICKKEQIVYYYDSLKGKDPELDNFANKLGINLDESENVLKQNGNLYIYDNIVENHYIGIEDYKGIYSVNSSAIYKKINLFDKDIYNKQITAIVGKYYISADYNEKYDFHEFKIINLENYSESTIVSNESISLDSYVQGVVGNYVYIIDRSNKVQYELDVKHKTIISVGNENTGIRIYKNGVWEDGNIYEAINKDLLFTKYSTNNTLNSKEYYRVDKVGNNLSGYYYIYKKTNNSYEVYRTPVQNTTNLNYLFRTSDINNVIYLGEYVYYSDKNYIKYFNEVTGVKTLAQYNDLEFNKNLKFYLYIK